jgi:catechol 1,2-dioxygenase
MSSTPDNSKKSPQGRPTDAATLLKTVLAENVRTKPERLKVIIDSLVKHLHAFALDTELTYEELYVGLDFLNKVGKATGPEKDEAILLSDVLGLSTLVQLQDAKRIIEHGGTEPGLIGPFWRANHPVLPSGASVCVSHNTGPKLEVAVKVIDLEGKPISNAIVDAWQASPTGFYENQDPEQADMNLRGRFITDATGSFTFWTVRPAGYPIPIDGPVGVLLEHQERNPMRPAHIHFIAIAQGYRVLSTQIFDEADPHIDTDVVFGAVGSLVRKLSPHPKDPQSLYLEVSITLEPGETRVPKPPID